MEAQGAPTQPIMMACFTHTRQGFLSEEERENGFSSPHEAQIAMIMGALGLVISANLAVQNEKEGLPKKPGGWALERGSGLNEAGTENRS